MSTIQIKISSMSQAIDQWCISSVDSLHLSLFPQPQIPLPLANYSAITMKRLIRSVSPTRALCPLGSPSSLGGNPRRLQWQAPANPNFECWLLRDNASMAGSIVPLHPHCQYLLVPPVLLATSSPYTGKNY